MRWAERLARWRWVAVAILTAGIVGTWWFAGTSPGFDSQARAQIQLAIAGAGVAGNGIPDAEGAESVPLEISFEPQAVEHRLRESVRYLASDELQGRAIFTRGIDLAAAHIARQYRAGGVRIDALAGRPFQEFYSSRWRTLGVPNRGEFWSPEGKRTPLHVTRDYIPLGWSANGSFDLPLAFVGYGITAPKLGYDDYAGMDVAGKAVVVLRREPQQNDPASIFDGTRNTEHANLGSKVTNAIQHGAAAVIFCTDQPSIAKSQAGRGGAAPDGAGKLPETDPLLNPNVPGKAPQMKVPVLHCRRWAVDDAVRASLGKPLEQLEQEIDQDLKPRSSPLAGWRFSGDVTYKIDGKAIRNVIGVLDGQGPLADETIVVGAHYDHLGLGGAGSLGGRGIHHGADDNASGTAVMVEASRMLAARPQKLARRVIFIAFSAEESGLIGSERYVGSPLVPLKQTVAMINLDMVGRLRGNVLTVYGTETAAEFPPMIGRLAGKYGLRLRGGSAEDGPSDHISFYEHRIPVLHFFTGLHDDYHRPSDTWEKLNYAGMQRITFLVADAVTALANAPRRPSRGRFGMTLDDLGLGGNPAEAPRPQPAPATPYLGMTANPAHQPPGYAVARVHPGGPAEQAGLRPGDVILRFGDVELVQPNDLRNAMGHRKPGEPVSLRILRDGTTFDLDLTLGRR